MGRFDSIFENLKPNPEMAHRFVPLGEEEVARRGAVAAYNDIYTLHAQRMDTVKNPGAFHPETIQVFEAEAKILEQLGYSLLPLTQQPNAKDMPDV